VTQPDYVPLQPSDRVRPSGRLSVPGPWRQDRPADLVGRANPTGARLGRTGPDLGYGLKLAKRFEDRLVLADGESTGDAVAGCFASGSRRAASFGRAPVVHDMAWAYTLWGYLGGAPEELVAWRSRLFRGASHHYWDQRGIVDAVRAETLWLTPAEVGDRLSSWRALLYTLQP